MVVVRIKYNQYHGVEMQAYDYAELTGAPVLTSAIFFVSVWKYVRENKFMILMGIYFCRQKKIMMGLPLIF